MTIECSFEKFVGKRSEGIELSLLIDGKWRSALMVAPGRRWKIKTHRRLAVNEKECCLVYLG